MSPSLQWSPEQETSLFHDEEMGSFGINNPLWHDDGDSYYEKDALFQLAEAISYTPRGTRVNPWEYHHHPPRQGAGQSCYGWLIGVVIILVPCIMGTKDKTLEPPPLNCPTLFNQTFADYLLASTNNSTSLCDETFAENCTCESTMVPTSLENDVIWKQKFERNKAVARNANDGIDMVILGDSLVEECAGHASDGRNAMAAVCHQLFQKESGGQVDGLALGIEGDRIGNLLYRLQHGELPGNLNPKVWWIQIGEHDISTDHCSSASITAGITAVVEEIREQRPAAKIVINSILPPGSSIDLNGAPWTSVLEANRQLECYSQTMDGVEFFDVTSLFVREDDGLYASSRSLDSLRKWGESVVEKVAELIEN